MRLWTYAFKYLHVILSNITANVIMAYQKGISILEWLQVATFFDVTPALFGR